MIDPLPFRMCGREFTDTEESFGVFGCGVEQVGDADVEIGFPEFVGAGELEEGAFVEED